MNKGKSFVKISKSVGQYHNKVNLNMEIWNIEKPKFFGTNGKLEPSTFRILTQRFL